MISLSCLLARPAALEHLEHAVRNKKSAHHVAGGRDDGDRAQHRRERALALAHQHNRSHHRNGVESVRQRHQRSVQQGRNVADDLEAKEAGQHENEQRINQVVAHVFLQFSVLVSPVLTKTAWKTATLPSARSEIHPLADVSAGSLKNSRTLAFTISPPRVTIVSRMISSCRLSCSLPSFTMYARNVVTLRAYIWLAWYGTLLARLMAPILVTPCSFTVSPVRVSSQLPPRSEARSTITEPGAIPLTISAVISTGDFFPGITAAVMTTSLSATTRRAGEGAGRPATPAPITNTRAGVIVPAAVVIMGKILMDVSAASSTA